MMFIYVNDTVGKRILVYRAAEERQIAAAETAKPFP